MTESIHGRGMIVIVSDFLVDREPLLKGLEMLCQRKHDILVFHVLDEDEMTFPFTGTTRFEGMEEMPNLLCDPAPCATATWKRWRSTSSRSAAAARGWASTTNSSAPAIISTPSCRSSCTTEWTSAPRRRGHAADGSEDRSQKSEVRSQKSENQRDTV